ncbi:RNA methyltransferase, partial [Hansschlegelia beijingensis]
ANATGGKGKIEFLSDGSADFAKAIGLELDASAGGLGILIAGGYRLDSVTPVDQFRHSAHVEAVARFSRS